MNTTISLANIPGPHRGQPILTIGESLAQAKAAMIMVRRVSIPTWAIQLTKTNYKLCGI